MQHILKRINPEAVGIIFVCLAVAVIGLMLGSNNTAGAYEGITGSVEADALTTCVEGTPIVTVQVVNNQPFVITAKVGETERVIQPSESQSFELAFEGPILSAGSTNVFVTYGGDGFGAYELTVTYNGIDCSQSTTTTTVAPTTTTVPVAPVELGPGGAVVYNDGPPPEEEVSQEEAPKVGLAICG